MTNAENPSYHPAPEAVFDALDHSPLLPLTVGILSAAGQPLTPSGIQQFIVEAAGQTDSEDDGPEPTHDTGEILATCQTLQQEGLAAISQEDQDDTEPYIRLTTIGEQIGVLAAYRLMERYIAQGHGDCHVPHKPNQQKLGIAGMIALGAVGVTAQVAKALAETLQVEAQAYQLVKDAIRNRPLRLRKPPSTPSPSPANTIKPFPAAGSHNPALPKSLAEQIVSAHPRSAKTKEFTSRILDNSGLLDRPKASPQPHKTSASPVSSRPSSTTTTEDQTPRTPATSDSPAPNTTTYDPKKQAHSGGIQPSPPAGPNKPQNNSNGTPDTPGHMPAKRPHSQQGRPHPQKSNTRTVTGGGSSGPGGETGGEDPSIEKVKTDLQAIVDKVDIIMANLCTAGNQAEAAAALLVEARRLASEALLPGAINPLELSPHCLSALREIAGADFDVCLAQFTRVATEATQYAGANNPHGDLRAAIQSIHQEM